MEIPSFLHFAPLVDNSHSFFLIIAVNKNFNHLCISEIVPRNVTKRGHLMFRPVNFEFDILLFKPFQNSLCIHDPIFTKTLERSSVSN